MTLKRRQQQHHHHPVVTTAVPISTTTDDPFDSSIHPPAVIRTNTDPMKGLSSHRRHTTCSRRITIKIMSLQQMILFSIGLHYILAFLNSSTYCCITSNQQQPPYQSSVLFVTATPYVLLKSKLPKCFQVKAPTNKQRVLIEYKCPDLVIVPEDGTPDTNILNTKASNDQQQQQHPKIQDGLDARFNVALQQKMDQLKKAHLKDINISVTARDANGLLLNAMTHRESDGKMLPRKIRHQVEATVGSFEFDLNREHDDYIEICIQSYSASTERPSRVTVDVTGVKTDEEIVFERELQQLQNSKRFQQMETTNQLVRTQTSRISSELIRMQRRTETIVREIEFAIERENEFRAKSISLNKAVRHYPIARILIILMAAIIQIHYIVDYMKSKHIY